MIVNDRFNIRNRDHACRENPLAHAFRAARPSLDALRDAPNRAARSRLPKSTCLGSVPCKSARKERSAPRESRPIIPSKPVVRNAASADRDTRRLQQFPSSFTKPCSSIPQGSCGLQSKSSGVFDLRQRPLRRGCRLPAVSRSLMPDSLSSVSRRGRANQHSVP